ncbi:hypothetical protein H0H81_006211 [Sphagnurus paluster]|uniref:Uncharacterized protein n=1 Tax=Sphagnurus paluster TaxID=117069 RepID=A0A9P7K205_9AGAR|nr:hypothetical protein H0H81_006211 [Sphagnurus paluster]
MADITEKSIAIEKCAQETDDSVQALSAFKTKNEKGNMEIAIAESQSIHDWEKLEDPQKRSEAFNKDASKEDTDIQEMRTVVANSPLGHPGISENQLGLAYIWRHMKHGRLSDLDYAVLYGGAAVSANPHLSPKTLLHDSALAFAYWHRFNRNYDPKDLQLSIYHNETALNTAPPGHPALTHCRDSLIEQHMKCYHRTGSLDELAKILS